MSNKSNMYWAVYKNLEKEVLDLSYYVLFSDKHISKSEHHCQLNTYSFRTADLLVKCVIEIESISKELYEQQGGNMNPQNEDCSKRDLYFDTDCLALLNQKWVLDKKVIIVSATNFYFEQDENIFLTPLLKADERDKCDWKKAYQAVKHNRVKDLDRANIKNLIRAMAALFILNIYYKDEVISLERVYMSTKKFDNRMDSDIFSVKCASATGLEMGNTMSDSNIVSLNGDNLLESIYIVKYTDSSFKEMHDSYCHDNEITLQNFYNSQQIRNYLEKHSDSQNKSINEICMEIGGIDFLKQIVSFSHMGKNNNTESQAILNKNQSIYPSLVYDVK